MFRSRPASLVASRVRVVVGVLVVTASMSGCVASTQVTEVVVVESPLAAQEHIVEVPAGVMLSGLRRFLAAASAGLPVDRLLAGDRFVVVTPVDILEVDARRSRGDVRMLSVGVPGACAGVCRVLLGEVLSMLAGDLEDPAAAPVAVVAPSPLESWPSLSVEGVSHRWRVSFDASGQGVFVVELLSGSF